MKVNIPIQGTIQSKLNWLIEYPIQMRFEFFLISFDLNSQGDSIKSMEKKLQAKGKFIWQWNFENPLLFRVYIFHELSDEPWNGWNS